MDGTNYVCYSLLLIYLVFELIRYYLICHFLARSDNVVMNTELNHIMGT